MKLLTAGCGALLSVVALCMGFMTPAFSETSNNVETGRVQICKIDGTSSAKSEIEVPADGKFVFTGAKVESTEPALITQTDFSVNPDATSQAKNNNTLKGKFDLENRDGKLIVHLKFNGSSCLYLNAETPTLQSVDPTRSGAQVAPNWVSDVGGIHTKDFSYRYFSSQDKTYYVASEVGRTVSFAVHDMQTGSNLSHDKVERVVVKNSDVLNLVQVTIKFNLERRNQADINLIDLEQFKISVKDLDFQSHSDVSELVAQLAKMLQPPPHSRLILALPKKAKVQLKFTNTSLEGNRLEGLGFYRDSNISTRSDSAETIVPIDAFANFELAMIDFDSATLVAAKAYTDGRIFFSSPYPETDLGDSVTDRRKLFALNGVVSTGVAKIMNGLFEVK